MLRSDRLLGQSSRQARTACARATRHVGDMPRAAPAASHPARRSVQLAPSPGAGASQSRNCTFSSPGVRNCANLSYRALIDDSFRKNSTISPVRADSNWLRSVKPVLDGARRSRRPPMSLFLRIHELAYTCLG